MIDDSAVPGGDAFAAVRAQEYCFPEGCVYLNAASWGPLPERSRASTEAFERRRQRGQLSDVDFNGVQDRARVAAARLLNADVSEVALTPNTSAALHLAAHFGTLRATPGRSAIVLSDREFPANVYPWLALGRRGFDVRLIPTTPEGQPDEDALARALDQPDVVLFSCSFVQFSTGFRADLARFARICRERGILFVVDAIQGLGALPLDVRAVGVDVLACGAQKWLCSPWGTGFAYVRNELCRSFEPYLPGWLAFRASRDFTRLVDYEYEMRDDAQRFEVGSLPNQSCIALAHSIELLLELGIERVYRHNLALQDRILDWVRQRGDVGIASNLNARSGILCIRPRAAAAAHAALLAAGVTCALREGSIRLSPHFYNSEADIDYALGVLDRCLG